MEGTKGHRQYRRQGAESPVVQVTGRRTSGNKDNKPFPPFRPKKEETRNSTYTGPGGLKSLRNGATCYRSVDLEPSSTVHVDRRRTSRRQGGRIRRCIVNTDTTQRVSRLTPDTGPPPQRTETLQTGSLDLRRRDGV